MENEIEDIFATFHDGGIIQWQGNFEELTLTIQCNYLAELFNEKFENFYITLYKIQVLKFDPWMNHPDLKKSITTEIKDVFAAELEIGYAKTEDNVVIVSCNQHDTDFDFCGGNLHIQAKTIKIADHNHKFISPQKLYEVSEKYWNKSH